MFKISQIPNIVKVIYFVLISFSLYTIYDHIDKYLGRQPINYCKKPQSNQLIGLDKLQILTPNTRSFDSDQIQINTQTLNAQNFDQLIQGIISKHFGDIKTTQFQVLNNYKLLGDQNTVQQLRSTVVSFLAKSKYMRQLSNLYQQLKSTNFDSRCQQVNLTDINYVYKKINVKIQKLDQVEKNIQILTQRQLDEKNKTYNLLTQLKWQKSKQQSNLRYYLHQLESDQYNYKKKLTLQQQKFLRDFNKLIKALENQIENLKQDIRQLGLNQDEVKLWRFQSINRSREVLTLKIQQLPLTLKINTIKDTIQNLQSVKRQNSQIIAKFQKQKHILQNSISNSDRKQIDKYYENWITRYLQSIKQLIQIKHYTFKKHKVQTTIQELEREIQKLNQIQKNLRLNQQIDNKYKQLQKLKKHFKQLNDLQDTDIQNSRKNIRQKIRIAQASLQAIDNEIKQIQKQSLNRNVQQQNIQRLKKQSQGLRKQLSPQYHIYINRVDQISKILSDCKSSRIKLQSRIKQLRLRIQELNRKSQSINWNLKYIEQILSEKIKQ